MFSCNEGLASSCILQRLNGAMLAQTLEQYQFPNGKIGRGFPSLCREGTRTIVKRRYLNIDDFVPRRRLIPLLLSFEPLSLFNFISELRLIEHLLWLIHIG